MACSLSNAKLILSAFVNGVSVSIKNRRGYTAATEGLGVISNMAEGSGAKSNVVEAGEEMMRGTIKEASSSSSETTKYWAPDPVTGYYRPEHIGAGEIDVAELREMLLNKSRQQH
ncbi:late embryogenesis abundant protein Lea5-like [Macadamia integrifolia]|uniref:late embryogenesis abundant protein Lea5-like n=1 Tax=Macadamia integrifolia TaxID=60698 RepID=UPI001C4E407B|nr:late embryogenesis abundant protein Lea5-like [Macadamia integrifolia]XP_042516023.1 late embryogenesis abundant protein Lea5-like [Macadamia integrifolia]